MASSYPPMYQADSPSFGDLIDASATLQSLSAIDWSFETEDTGFLAHDVHPYPAKFIPQIPGHLIARLSLPGDFVLDPFGGSGTTALEAIRLGRRAASIDANPLGSLIGEVKTTSLSRQDLEEVDSLRATVAAQLESTTVAAELLIQHADMVPVIPHREKWFADQSVGELAYLRHVLASVGSTAARNIGLLALSRTVHQACFQDSETRYASKPRTVSEKESLATFIRNLNRVLDAVALRDSHLMHGSASFVTEDAYGALGRMPNDSVDLVVTSPPYGNAYDYHLYLRFRLLWLGFDPVGLGRQEIGSHLRHQREGSGFREYLAELGRVLAELSRVARPGRYVALVLGNPIYGGRTYSITEELSRFAATTDLEFVGSITRPIHGVRRSVSTAARRAQQEDIILFQKQIRPMRVHLAPLPYTPWQFEKLLRDREAAVLTGARPDGDGALVVDTENGEEVYAAKRLAFTHQVVIDQGVSSEPTWQAILENGSARLNGSSRKDPKYVTHGLHDYKGKFYPQLAKALINMFGRGTGTTVLDPFCGSGTTLLEAYLGGCRAIGLDMNPLAARVAAAKVGVLGYSPSVVEDTSRVLLARLDRWDPQTDKTPLDQFPAQTHDEILSWFPESVAYKLNAILRTIRNATSGDLQKFFEALLSSIVREVSHQEPRDLRIRRRASPLTDADALGLFRSRLDLQMGRLRKFWDIRGYCPHKLIPASVSLGDSRTWEDLASLGIGEGEIDLVLTSPPYAVALPYIDTDRLSLLVLDRLTSSMRRPIEQRLTGSREILASERTGLENELESPALVEVLPEYARLFLASLLDQINRADVGFRRRNMPALLTRYCLDMQAAITNCTRALSDGGHAVVVIGDSRMRLETGEVAIPTTQLIKSIAENCGLSLREEIKIDVTTDNSLHRRNSITENRVLVLGKS